MALDSVLDIIAYGAWNEGKPVDNSFYEQKGLSFKGGIPVNNKTIEERIGVRSRRVAPLDERIGASALQNLLDTSGIDPGRIKVVIGATNVGDDKYDPGPLIRHPYGLIREYCPEALVLDLYAGCPGTDHTNALVRKINRFMWPSAGVKRITSEGIDALDDWLTEAQAG